MSWILSIQRKTFFRMCIVGGIIMLLIALVLWMYVLDARESRVIDAALLQSNPLDITQTEQYWSWRMDEVGLSQAYDEYREMYQSSTQADQHTAGHIIGELLYEQYGVDGFADCDHVYLGACLHAFVSTVIVDRGPEAIDLIVELCERLGKKESSCKHGIGHGIGAYYNIYQEDVSPLLRAFGECSDVEEWKETYNGCPAGVMMEYHHPYILKMHHREFSEAGVSEDDLINPCANLPQDYQPGCYFALSEWWKRIFHNDYERMFQICDAAPPGRAREACYYGIAENMLETQHYDLPRAVGVCDSLSRKEFVAQCRIGAIWSLKYDRVDPDRYQVLCDSDIEAVIKYCRL